MIFVDTLFWYALRVVRDPRHQEARTLLDSCERRTLVTTNLVVGELWTLLVRRAGHDAAVRAIRALRRRQGMRIDQVERLHSPERARQVRRGIQYEPASPV